MGCKHALFSIALVGLLLVVACFMGGGHERDSTYRIGERFMTATRQATASLLYDILKGGERIFNAIRQASTVSLLDPYYYCEGGRREYYNIENGVEEREERDISIGERVMQTAIRQDMGSLLYPFYHGRLDIMKRGERVWIAIRQAIESLLDPYYYEGGRAEYYIENGVKWIEQDHELGIELEENPSIIMMKNNPEGDEREGRTIGERFMTTIRQAITSLLYDIMKGGERVLNAIRQGSIVSLVLDPYYYYEGGRGGRREYYIENGVEWVDPDEMGNGLVEKYIPSINMMRNNQMGCNESSMDVLVVDPTGFGDYTSIQSAINGAPKNSYNRLTILVAAGTYLEKILIPITKPCITLQGQGKDTTIISWNDTSNSSHGTRWSSTMAIEAVHFIARNISFKNTSPPPDPGVIGAQAIALRVSNDQAAFYGCGIYGAQDTLNDDQGRHYFKDCYIEGSIDFIFGDARSLYESCDIHSIAKPTYGSRVTGSITAHARRSVDENTGFIFVNCTIFGTGLIWLGRAWGSYAITIFAYTYMSGIIVPTGWNDWNDPLRDSSIYFGEYMCSGPGSNTSQRVPYSTILNDTQASIFINRSFINSDDWLLDWDSKSMLWNKRHNLENMKNDGYNSSSQRFIS